MGSYDSRIDSYIDKSAEFARPILEHIRSLVHEFCPDVAETMKWGMPHYEYKGVLCSMASFKAHCAFGFWRGREVLGDEVSGDAMGQFGRITSVKDLPSNRIMGGYIRKAMSLNDSGTKPAGSRRPAGAKEEIPVPEDMSAALAGNKKARATFEGFSPGHRREYLEWITEARTEATRQKRIGTAMEWLAEGKDRNWKYKRRT
jgi:uncharacterized protein YdeI (YjbR/CyaY-like superfamily)